MNIDVDCPDGIPDYAEPVPDPDLDWTWPAADTFTDDSIAPRTIHTCSELGSQRIRLIKIRPGRPRDTIECDTKVCFLSEAGEYTALTYTWGCPVERCHIIVDDQPRLVTVNLWRFLLQARQLPEQFSGWLWIDALSIEQSDAWEKLEQVKMISKIFEKARPVVIWLGPAFGNSDRAMEILATYRTGTYPWRAPRRLWAFPTYTAMLELCTRPYWHRLWVYQELSASQRTRLMCGSGYVYFSSLIHWLFGNNDERVKDKVQALRSSSAGMMISLIYSNMDRSLPAMLDSTGHLRCTDPRDKVYAILNVVSSGHQGIEADYTNNLPNLMNQILRNIHASKRPDTLYEVSEQCQSLEVALRMSPGSMFTTKGNAVTACCDHMQRLFVSSMLTTEKLDLMLKEVRAWCEYHDHQAIAQMIRQTLPGLWGLDEPDLELAEWERNMHLARAPKSGLKHIELCGELGKILKSFESICGGMR